jgi:hypothetical protein
MNKYTIMKKLQSKQSLVILALAILAVCGYNLTPTMDVGTVKSEAIIPAVDVVDVGFIPGTQRLGDVVLSVFKANIEVNSSTALNISTATVTLYNSTDEAVNATSAITTFPSSVLLYLPSSEVSKSETYYMNVSATGSIDGTPTTYVATSGEYNNRPTYSSTEAQYGSLTEINSETVGNALAYKALYYPNKQIIELVAVDTANISVILGG